MNLKRLAIGSLIGVSALYRYMLETVAVNHKNTVAIGSDPFYVQ